MSFLFLDSLDAYHYDEITDDDGSRSNVRASEPFQHNLNCQMSFGGHENASPKGNVKYPEQRAIEIFIRGIDYGFKRGDWVVVRRDGAAVYEGAIGEPRIYNRLIVHTELMIEAWKEIGNG